MIGDEKDETGQSIRQSLDTTLPPHIVVAKKRKGELEREFELTGLEVSSEAYPSLHIYYTDQEEIREISIKEPREVASRIRTRVLSSTYEWPIKHFSTLDELLRVLQGAIQGKYYLCVFSEYLV